MKHWLFIQGYHFYEKFKGNPKGRWPTVFGLYWNDPGCLCKTISDFPLELPRWEQPTTLQIGVLKPVIHFRTSPLHSNDWVLYSNRNYTTRLWDEGTSARCRAMMMTKTMMMMMMMMTTSTMRILTLDRENPVGCSRDAARWQITADSTSASLRSHHTGTNTWHAGCCSGDPIRQTQLLQRESQPVDLWRSLL